MNTKLLPLVFYKVRAGLWSDASKTYLSFLWWVLEPILTMLTYYLVFGILLVRGTDDFVVFLLCGLTSWLWFSKSVSVAMMSVLQARGLIHQVNIEKWFFPAVSVGKETFKSLIVLLIMLAFLLVYGLSPTVHWLGAIPVLFTEFLLILAISFSVAAIVPFLPDLSFVISSLLQFLMFVSGVFYSLDIMPAKYHELFLLNPMAFLIHSLRQTLLWNQWPDWTHLGVVAILSLLLLGVSMAFFTRFDRVYPRVVN